MNNEYYRRREREGDMSLTNVEIIEQVIQTLEDLDCLIRFEGGTGVADFSEWSEDIDDKLKEAQAALVVAQEQEKVLGYENYR